MATFILWIQSIAVAAYNVRSVLWLCHVVKYQLNVPETFSKDNLAVAHLTLLINWDIRAACSLSLSIQKLTE